MNTQKHVFYGAEGRYVAEVDFDRVTAERDALQQLLNGRDEELNRLRLTLSARQAAKPSQRFVAPVDCEDCGDTGVEPCSRHVTIGGRA